MTSGSSLVQSTEKFSPPFLSFLSKPACPDLWNLGLSHLTLQICLEILSSWESMPLGSYRPSPMVYQNISFMYTLGSPLEELRMLFSPLLSRPHSPFFLGATVSRSWWGSEAWDLEEEGRRGKGKFGRQASRKLMGEESWQTERHLVWVVSSSISTSTCWAMSQTRDLQGREGGIGRILKWEKGAGQYWAGGLGSWPMKAEL